MFLPRPGALLHVIAQASASTSVTLPHNPWGRDLLILHGIAGSPATGGHVTPLLTPDGGTTTMPHHGDATGVHTTNQVSSYSAIVRDVTDVVVLQLTVVDGVHDVWVQVLA